MDKWINTRPESERDFFKAMCEKYVHGSIRLIIDGMLGLQHVAQLKMIIPQTALNMVICPIKNNWFLNNFFNNSLTDTLFSRG